MKKIKEFFAKYHIPFFIALVLNLFFLVREIYNFSQFQSALSIFTIVLYLTSLIYMSLMELFEYRNKSNKWSYIFTLWYLLINGLLLPITILLANAIDSLSAVYNVYTFTKGEISIIILLLIYFAYLLYKIIKPIVKSVKAKKKKDDYERASNFGDVLEATMTLISSFAGLFALFMSMYAETMFVNVNSAPFMVSAAIATIINLIFFIKCIIGIRRIKKEEKQADSVALNDEQHV